MEICFFGTSIYSVLSHEVYHGINRTKDGIGLSFYNKDMQLEGVALEEAFTEAASYRTSFNRFDELDSFTEGYHEITFVVNLLSAALGTTDRELLRSGITNRQELMNFFNSRFSSKEDSEFARNEYFTKFEESLNILYNVEYSSEGNEALESELRKTALISLYESCYNLASYQISSDKMNTSSKYVSEVIYRFIKLGTVVEDSMYRVIGREKPEELLGVVTGIEGSIKALADKVVAMNELSKNFNAFSDYGSYYKQFEDVKSGMNNEKRKALAENYGIIIPEDSVKVLNGMDIDSEYREYVFREDFDNGKTWSNERIVELLIEMYKNEMQRVGANSPKTEWLESNEKIGFFDKAIRSINILISKFENRGVPQLNASEVEAIHFKKTNALQFDEKYRVNINEPIKSNPNGIERYQKVTNDKGSYRVD